MRFWPGSNIESKMTAADSKIRFHLCDTSGLCCTTQNVTNANGVTSFPFEPDCRMLIINPLKLQNGLFKQEIIHEGSDDFKLYVVRKYYIRWVDT